MAGVSTASRECSAAATEEDRGGEAATGAEAGGPWVANELRVRHVWRCSTVARRSRVLAGCAHDRFLRWHAIKARINSMPNVADMVWVVVDTKSPVRLDAPSEISYFWIVQQKLLPSSQRFKFCLLEGIIVKIVRLACGISDSI
jgi:hypothetical protein